MINRQEAATAFAGLLTDQLVVTSLGFPTNDLYSHRDRPQNFYLMGSMGSATPIAFGLAMTRPDRRVICLAGDGSLLMNLGALATVGRYAPPNLTCVVLDNQLYQMTGGQPTHTGFGTDLAMVARGCGIASSTTVHSLEDLQATLRRVFESPGPHVVVAKVDSTPSQRLLVKRGLTRALPLLRYRFMWKLGVLPEAEGLVWE